MKTYDEVANAYEMQGEMKSRYIRYMRTRWSETEVQKCSDGYAHEWAGRFIHGVEFRCSDSTGQTILNAMDKEK